LSGSAFAMHITPAVANNQNGAGQGNPNQQENSNQDPESAATAALTPTASASGDPTTSKLLLSNTPQTQSSVEAQQVPGLSSAPIAAWPAAASSTAAPQQTNARSTISTTWEAGEIGAEEATGAPQTVRTVQVQLTGEGEGRVDLRLVQHGDGLSVSVRASDSALTKGLQENLPELSARLAAEKYQTHTFLPAATETASGGSSSGSSDRHSGQSQDQASNRSFSQNGNGGQSNQREQPDQGAAWWRQLAALNKLSASLSNSTAGAQSSQAVQPQAN
jgi:Flagellar hook-length control protein FliK